MSQKELHRGRVLEEVVRGRLSLLEGAELMSVSYRQAKRLKARYEDGGVGALAHGNRGRPVRHALSGELRRKVLELSGSRYKDFNDVHFVEKLREKEGIQISRESVRLLRRGAGQKPKRRRRPPKHFSRRQRKGQAGMMIQWDGSPHRWFGPNRPPCCLLSAVDDATSRLLAARFVPVESAGAYLELLDTLLHHHGIPLSIYHDRHSSLVRNDEYWSIEEELQGRQYPTHVGRVLEELGIRSIPARSPQAKGRIERSFGTLQDRLVAELALEGIRDMETANRWLEDVFIDRYNDRFGQEAEEAGSAFRAIRPKDRYQAIAFAYEATVARDNCVRLGGLLIDIPPGRKGRSFAGRRVLVKQHLDGAWTVWDQGRQIAAHEPTPFREPVRSWKARRGKESPRGRKAIQVYIASRPAMPTSL